MSLNFKVLWEGLRIKAKSVLNSDTKGELEVDSATGKMHLHNGTSRSPIVTEAHTATLTNKTIDANGTGNSITNIEVADLASGVLNTSITLATASDTQVPSALAVKTYVDNKDAAQNEASEIAYSNIVSGLAATNVQTAIDEVEGRLDSAQTNIGTNATNISNHIASTTAHTAANLVNVPSGNISSTTVQAALNEVQTHVDTVSGSSAGVQTNLTTHINNTTGAHAASAISNTPSGNLAATQVQAALNELQSDIDTRATSSNLSAHTGASTGVHGVVGAVVGTTDSQVLTNKTLTAPAISSPTGLVKADVGLSNVDNTSDATKNSAIVALTNKTIDASANTISNIVNANINASAAIARTKLASGTANKVIVNDGSGVLAEMSGVVNSTNAITLDNTKHLELQAINDSTSTGSNATLATFNGGAVRLTNSSLVSISNIPAGVNGQQVVIFNRTGASVSVVDSSAATGTAAARIYTGTSANIAFAKDAALILSYDSTSARWQVIGGTGGGSSELPLGVLAQQTFESAVLTDFTQTGLTLVTASNLLIKNTKAAQLISNASVTQSFKQVIPVDNQFRGKNLTVDLYTRSSATQGNVTVLFYNETSSVNLVASQPITLGSTTISATTAVSTTLSALSVADVNKLKVGQTITGSGIVAGTTIASINSAAFTATLSQAATAAATVTLRISDLPQRQSFSFDVPTNCASLSYTISALAESGSPESYFDDIAIKLSATALSSTSISIPTAVLNTFAADIASGGTVTSTSTNFIQSVTNPSTGNYVITYVSGTFSVAPAVVFSLASNVTTAVITAQSASSVSISVYDTVPRGTQVNSPFNITVTKQGVDFINPLTATTSTVIPLTSAQLVQTPDSYLQMNGFSGDLASTNTQIYYLTGNTFFTSTGDAIQYNSSTVFGDSFVATKDGTYNFNISNDSTAASGQFGLSKNSTQLSTSYGTITNSSERLMTSANSDVASLNWTGKLIVGDIVRLHNLNANGLQTGGNSSLSISYQGSLKQLNVSSDAKITIPTHSLRFEGASTRGSTDTAIVRFDSQTITQGDGFSVVNTAANGTVVTIKKAGKLNVTAVIRSASNTDAYITKNTDSLTSVASLQYQVAHLSMPTVSVEYSFSGVTDVVVGDVIRLQLNTTPSGVSNLLSLSLTENSIPANFSNVLPQWSQSDSSIRLNTANGSGSTNTAIRRFSNTVDNLGTAISYQDSATLGASFTINEDGEFQISYSDNAGTASHIGISKNSTQLSTAINTISTSDRLSISTSAAANYSAMNSWSGNLVKGDVIRPHTGNDAGGTATMTTFTISKVGKPNLTSVDVTPFVNMKTTDVEFINTNQTALLDVSGEIRFTASLFSTTNLGVMQVIDDTANTRTKFVALKKCNVNISASVPIVGAATELYIYKNGSLFFRGINQSISTYSAIATTSVSLEAGDFLSIATSATAGTASTSSVSITATADNNATASPTQQVSSDTISFAFKATAIDPAVDAVGTFNTYTYSVSSNVKTIGASAPTQTVSDMNINGIQVTIKAYNEASTTATPSAVDIFIGKGLKSSQVNMYKSTLKTTGGLYDRYNISNGKYGADVVYDEKTGILSIDARFDPTGSSTSGNGAFAFKDATTQASAYFVFNASKSPSLVTVPNLQQRIAYLSDVKANSTAAGASAATTTQTRTLNTLVDSTGIVTSLVSNQFVLPAGTYNIEASAPAIAPNTHKARIRNITDSTTAISGTSEYNAAASVVCTRSICSGEITITSPKTFELQHYTSAATAIYGLGTATATGDTEVYSICKITRIK